MSALNLAGGKLPLWIKLQWDDGDGLQVREGFLTEYEHIEREPRVFESYTRPRITRSECMDTFRFVINGEELELRPDFQYFLEPA